MAQAELVRSGEATPLELVDAAIERIEAVDGDLNAVIHRRFDEARAEAQSSDLGDGPFRGVPMLLKDLWPASAGDPFHMGNPALKAAGYRHPTDANIVTRYRQAGFVIVGRTNTPELGLSATTEPMAYGPTHNPWNTNHGAGGSSGGAAAAVASGMIPAANASDGGGSIRIPAAMTGLVGLKPSRGRISMGPLQDEWGMSCQHVVSHTVRDTASILDATCAPFLGDGVVAPGPARPYLDEVGANPGRLRIGLLDTNPRLDVNPECVEVTRKAGQLLESLGHEVADSHPEAMDQIVTFNQLFSTLARVGAVENMERLGALLGRKLGQDDVEPGTWAMAQGGAKVTGAEVLAAQAAQHEFRRLMAQWWEQGWDLLLTPTTAEPPPPLGKMAPSADDPFRSLTGSVPYAAFTSPFNTTGQPAISLPLHRTADGLPVGAQLVAAYGREDLLIQVAAQLEAEVQWANERAPMHL